MFVFQTKWISSQYSYVWLIRNWILDTRRKDRNELFTWPKHIGLLLLKKKKIKAVVNDYISNFCSSELENDKEVTLNHNQEGKKKDK